MPKEVRQIGDMFEFDETNRQLALQMQKYVALLSFISIAASSVVAGELIELPRDEYGSCTHSFSGEILPGDVERVEALLPRWDSNDRVHVVCLDSLGGNYRTGIELALLFREGNIGTRVMDGDECLSACAIAFTGGSIGADDFSTSRRSLQPGAVLGFHAPQLVVNFETDDEAFIGLGYQTALESIAQLAQNSAYIRFDIQLLANLLRFSGSDQFYFIDTIGQANRYGFEIDMNVAIVPDPSRIVALCDNAYDRLNAPRLDRPRQNGFSVAEYVSDVDVSITRQKDGTVVAHVGHYPPEALYTCRVVIDDSPTLHVQFVYYEHAASEPDVWLEDWIATSNLFPAGTRLSELSGLQ